jgi:hypothetical protein
LLAAQREIGLLGSQYVKELGDTTKLCSISPVARQTRQRLAKDALQASLESPTAQGSGRCVIPRP